MNRSALAILPLLLVANAGCTVLLSPGEAQCETAKDCEARGFSGAVCTEGVCEAPVVVDEVWGCLGHVTEPKPDLTKKVHLAVQLTLAADKSVVTDAMIDVCDKLDVDCLGTNPDFPKGLAPDSKGLVAFDVVQGFDGFVRVTGPNLMDSRVYVGRPIITAPKVKEVRLLTVADYGILIAYAGEMLDKTRGTSIILEVDCKGDSASGVRFETPNADTQTTPFYLINQIPTAPPTAKETDIDGFGGFFNMPVGSSVARSFRAKDDAYIGESSFQVLANTISYVQIAPTPK
ncbi:MAG: hypothetical protein QM820_43780 [Minicystis sp.]